MSGNDPLLAYLALANELFTGKTTEQEISPATKELPSLNDNLFDKLTNHIEKTFTNQPRYGWAVSFVTYQAATAQNCDLFLHSRAAWHWARACNHWTQPKRVREAITIARRGFDELHELGWLAACDWQENALAWTKPNFAEAAQRLNEALTNLKQASFEKFVPECRLALAYAQILIREHNDALENIRLSEETYHAQGDRLNQARCWLNQASVLRRQELFDDAQKKLEETLVVFKHENALTDQGKAHYQMALGYLLQANHLVDAAEQFQKAEQLFKVTDLDLWYGMCINNLGSVYLIQGQLKDAKKYYEQARFFFEAHETHGLLADNLNDNGKLNVLMGEPAQSIAKFKQAEKINEILGSQLPAAIAISNLGEAYGLLGRYQDALYHLERAADRLETLNIHFRLATCEKYIAVIWSQLGQPEIALDYLGKAETHYEMADQKALLSSVYNYKAAAFLQQKRIPDAIQSLKQSLGVANTYEMRPQSALAKRLLGESLMGEADNNKALNYLEQAYSDFAEMGMALEQANCLLAIGRYHGLMAVSDKAEGAFQKALQLSEGTFPEIDWQAHAELGTLAAKQGDIKLALRHYRIGLDAFTQIRENFLQPVLAGYYLQSPSLIFNQMISVVVEANAIEDALHFVEGSKATTLLRQLANNYIHTGNTDSEELNDLKAQIDQMREDMRVPVDEVHPFKSAFQFQQQRELLKAKIKQYDTLKARLERQTFSHKTAETQFNRFSLNHFREKASSILSNNWVVLEYYTLEDTLIIIVVTPHNLELHSKPITNRFMMALTACDNTRRNIVPLTQSDLKTLGNSLIPNAIDELLTPDTTLLIAPHKSLHQVPWSAIRPEFSSQPLVSLCTPNLIPSMQALTLLWSRQALTQATDRINGLLVGLSSFNGLYAELPSIRREISEISSRVGFAGQVLAEENATMENLLKIKEVKSLSRFTWLHIASHFFADRQTGRLSRIALHGGDIFLDQLRDLAPLPPIVSLSACNSNDSFIYEGDERMDLQTTCLMAGANAVVGNTWPVQDDASPELMILYYDFYLSGMSPAKAVAHAQRHFIEYGKKLETWASFICAGIP